MAEGAATSAQSETPLRLLSFALIWIVASALAGLLTSFAVGFVIGSRNALRPDQAAWVLSPVITFFSSTIALQLVLLLSARSRARIVGHGDRSAGLGSYQIYRPGLLAAFVFLELACAFSWATLLAVWVGPIQPVMMVFFVSSAGPNHAWIIAGMLVLVVGLAPLAEELFFRGWLWTGLRRHWQAVPVGVATAIPWLLLHIADGGVRRLLFLIPSAIFYSLARHICGGVRASLVLHGINNLAAAGLVGLTMLLQHR